MAKPKRRLNLDAMNKDLKGVSIGDTATVVVQGKVTSLEAEREYSAMCCSDDASDKKEKWPARVELEISSLKFTDQDKNAFSKMADDDMAETDGD